MKKSGHSFSSKTALYNAMRISLPVLFVFFTFSVVKSQTADITGNYMLSDRSRGDKPSKQFKGWTGDGRFASYEQGKELISKRDANAKHFINTDGSVTAVISAGNVHYKDESGQWKDIRTDIRPNASGTYVEYPYAVLENNFQLYFPETLDNGYIIQTKSGDVKLGMKGEIRLITKEMQVLKTMTRTSAFATVSDNTMKFDESYPYGYDMLTVRRMGIDHDIVLDEKPPLVDGAPEHSVVAFREFISLPEGWKIVGKNGWNGADYNNVAEDGGLAVIDDHGNLIIEFRTPYIYEKTERMVPFFDAKTGKTTEEHYTSDTKGFYRVEAGDGGYFVETCVPSSWLNDPDRKYPVVIDPTTCYPAALNWTGWNETSALCHYGLLSGGDYLFWVANYTGCAPYTSTPANSKGFMYFNTASITDGSTISNIDLSYYVYGKSSGTPWYYIREMSTFSLACSDKWTMETTGTTYLDYKNCSATGWYTHNALGGSTANTTLQSNLASDFFGCAFDEYETSGCYWVRACGTLDASDPYVVVTYTAPPANDACANATPLPCGTAGLAGTTVNCVSETPGTGCSVSAYGVWYTFTGDGNLTTITSTATFDHEMDIVYGSCGSFTPVVCRDTTAGSTEAYTFTPANGTTYYVYIAYFTTGAITGTFTISRSCCSATPLADDTPVASSIATTNWSYIANASDLTIFGVSPEGTGDKDCYVYSDCFTTQVATSTGTNKADYVIENRHAAGTNTTRNGRVSYSTPAYTVEMENNVPHVTSGTITTADLSSNEAFDFYEFYCTETASDYDFQILSIIDSDVNPDIRVFEFTGDGFKNKSQASWSSTSSSPTVNHEIDIRNVTCTSGRYYGIVVERAGAEDSASVYWMVVNRRPGDPVLTSPVNGAVTCAGASQTFSWKSVTDPDGSAVTYRVWVRAGVAPTYTLYTDRSGFLSDTTWTWSPAGGLVAGTTYYWMVFTWDGVDYELCGAGTIWNFTPTGTPASPVAATQTPSGTQIVWDWNAVAGATGYKWSTTNNYGTAIDLGNVSSYTQTGLSCGTMYTVYVWAYNGCGYSAVTTLSSTTSPVPTAEAGVNVVYTGTPVQLGSITNGPGTCSWGPPAGLDNSNSCQPMASPLSTTTYTLVVNNNGCIATDNVTITFGGLGHTISGRTLYAGKANAGNPVPNAPTYNATIYSMYGMIVMLKNYPANDLVAKDTSDASGNYQFTNVMDGNYILSYDKYTIDSMLWANDVNAIDVALMKYLVGSDTLQDPTRCFSSMYKKAGNVDNNIAINAVDVARMKAKIGAPYDPARNFPKGNWVALEKLVNVAGSDINVNLETISYGDYNASSSKYRDSLTNWSGIKSIPADIIVISGEYVTTSDQAYFELPLRISAKMNEFSAMGLELNYSAAEYKLVSAYMPKAKTKGAVKINPSFEEVLTDDNDLLVTDAGGVIRVVYATTDHFDVAANDEMIVLGFRSLNDPDKGAHEFNLSGTGVIANQYGEETDGTYLLVPKIFVQGRATDTEFEFSGHPNPFSSEATITYNLPDNGSVKLMVYNVLGKQVSELVNEAQESGKHSVVFSSKNLPAGLYTFKLDYNGEKLSNCAVLKMIH